MGLFYHNWKGQKYLALIKTCGFSWVEDSRINCSLFSFKYVNCLWNLFATKNHFFIFSFILLQMYNDEIPFAIPTSNTLMFCLFVFLVCIFACFCLSLSVYCFARIVLSLPLFLLEKFFKLWKAVIMKQNCFRCNMLSFFVYWR